MAGRGRGGWQKVDTFMAVSERASKASRTAAWSAGEGTLKRVMRWMGLDMLGLFVDGSWLMCKSRDLPRVFRCLQMGDAFSLPLRLNRMSSSDHITGLVRSPRTGISKTLYRVIGQWYLKAKSRFGATNHSACTVRNTQVPQLL